MPSHASREVLILLGSLTSCDPGDIDETVKVETILRSYSNTVDCRCGFIATTQKYWGCLNTFDIILRKSSSNHVG